MSVEWFIIYNSRNYSILLNVDSGKVAIGSTTVEIILYYLTSFTGTGQAWIYNSRNYSILLNDMFPQFAELSTTVEIILYYLTSFIMPS